MRLPRLAALVAAALLAACSAPEERAERAREAARRALARGDRAAALAELKELRELKPDTPEALLELGTLLVQAGEAPQAVWLLEAGVGRFPERADLRLALAQVALLVNDPSRARAAVEPIAADSEHHLNALVMRGQAELQLGDLERALATFEEAEGLYPERPQGRIVRILTLLRERRHDEARALLEETKRSAELFEGWEAIRRLEIALYGIDAAQGRTDVAIAGLQALLDEDGGNLEAWRALIPILWRLGRIREAADLLTDALESDPERLALYPTLASLQAALGQADEAERSLRVFVDRSQSPSAYVALAQFYAARGDPERMLALYAEALNAFPEEAMLRRLHAEALVSAGRVEEARAELARFREAAPGDPNAQYLRARIELAEGDAAGAARRLEKWIPELDHPATQFWLGQALEALGDRAGAERRYGLAIARGSSDPTPYLAAIRLAERRGDWRAVAGNAHRLVLRAPGHFEGWRALIAALTNLGEGKPAEGIAERSVRLFPDRPEPRVLLAVAFRIQGRYAEALEQLSEAGELFGRTPEIEAEQALTEGMSGRVPEAIATARGALEESPDSAHLHLVLAALLFRAGEADDGARAAERALELDPDDPRPLRIRAEFRAATGRLDEARRDCERYLALRPDDPVVHYVLAAVHEKSGRTEAAIASYRRAAELDEAAFAPRNNLAGLLAAQGDLDAALEAAQQAYAIADDDPYVMDTLGALYLQKGLVDRSISLLEDAHAAAPGLPDAQLHLALAYREAGRTEDARRLLSELVSRGGEGGELRAEVDEALASLP